MPRVFSVFRGAAEASIRLRILKVDFDNIFLSTKERGRGFDPTEDTERVPPFPVPVQTMSGRGFDPTEDTESRFFRTEEKALAKVRQRLRSD